MTKSERHVRTMLSPLRYVALLVLMGAIPAYAQELSQPSAVSIPLEQATDIKSQPLSLLSKFPSAGPALARYVAQALTKEPEALDAVLSIIPDTSPEQAAAIGAGMVRAIRALSGKQAQVASNFAFKILQSDNKFLKTTFLAIGPRGPGKPPARDGVDYPYPTANNVGGGGALGDALDRDKGRVGPAIVRSVFGISTSIIDKNPFMAPLNMDLTRYGMIVAIIKSDAPSNGAVSTSP